MFFSEIASRVLEIQSIPPKGIRNIMNTLIINLAENKLWVRNAKIVMELNTYPEYNPSIMV